ncbi:Uncharacterized protein BM_BM5950 [Brugia malayi]|uniref:Bm5950, isoform b n=1 Tax=Brugia malayi TaxID=6279 RepID=A0A0J9XQS4_BRUMA|nr:Uncharacterized protein BM_BM5950 [Brugia malayi]CDP93099.2 Bm5950, isoform b [Brugia malayi]VIO87334.1 Uncharacterized protein BM_BM5950 [Brugia malayi]
MAEVEDGRAVQVNGTGTDDMKTKVMSDNDVLNDEQLNTDNSQVVTVVGSTGSEILLEETKIDQSNEIKAIEEGPRSEEQQESNKLNNMEVMEQAVEKVEAKYDLDHNEINEAEIKKEKPIHLAGDEAVEEQVIEDRTEDQVPDITGTDNADVMATSMDSIDELPTSEEQAVETSALVEQEAELFVKSETDNVEIAPITETEAPIEEERIAIGSEVEIPQELHEAETMLEEKVVPTDEATDVNVEAPQNDDKAKELLTEQNPAAPEEESEELEVEGLKETEPEVEQVQDQLKHTEPLEVTEVIQEVVTEQSLATNESEAIMDELSEAAAEEIKKEDLNNERNEPSNVELPNEQQQPMECGNEAEENSFVSALLPEEKSETIHSSHTSSLKFEETSDGPMATPLMTEQEFTFDEDKPVSKTSITDDKVLSQKKFTTEEKNSSRKTSAMEDEVSSRKVSAMEGEGQDRSSRKVSAMEEKALSRKTSAAEEEKLQSRKSSEVKEKKIPSRKSSVIQEAKTPSRKTSESEEKISSRKTSVVEEEKIASKKSSIAQERVLPRKISSQMDEKAPSRKASKMKSVEENSETTEFSPELAAAPQSERAGKAKIAKVESNEAKIEPELEPIVEPKSATEETVVEAKEAKIIAESPTGKINDEAPFEDATAEDVENEEKKVPEEEKYAKEEEHAAVNERESLPPARQIISSPPRRRSPSPVRRDTNRENRESKYKSYDQDTHRQRGPPPRMPNYLSFSSYIPVEKKAYSPVSPWVQNAAQKYRNDYTAASAYKPKSIYTSIFDDTVNSGPFSSDLYSVNRLLERSRSRSRELRNALRSKRSTSNYYRYTSNYATPPLRTRDYSTPPLSSVYHSSSRSGSFISFMEYSGQKQYELARSPSRFSNFDGLSRASSRSNVDMFYDMERLSRVDSYVRDLNRNTEYGFPSTYVKYRSPSRPYLPQEYTPINGYRAYPTTNSPSSSTLSRLYSGFARHWTMGS